MPRGGSTLCQGGAQDTRNFFFLCIRADFYHVCTLKQTFLFALTPCVHHGPLCSSSATGHVYVYESYRVSDSSVDRRVPHASGRDQPSELDENAVAAARLLTKFGVVDEMRHAAAGSREIGSSVDSISRAGEGSDDVVPPRRG